MVLQCSNGVGSNPVEGRTKNLTALKSNSNTVWFNFQTYIYIYIYIYNTTNFLQQFLHFYNNNRRRKSRDDGAMVERQSPMLHKCCKFRNVICFLYEYFYYLIFFQVDTCVIFVLKYRTKLEFFSIQ